MDGRILLSEKKGVLKLCVRGEKFTLSASVDFDLMLEKDAPLCNMSSGRSGCFRSLPIASSTEQIVWRLNVTK
jgi:hypothetical protein